MCRLAGLSSVSNSGNLRAITAAAASTTPAVVINAAAAGTAPAVVINAAAASTAPAGAAPGAIASAESLLAKSLHERYTDSPLPDHTGSSLVGRQSDHKDDSSRAHVEDLADGR